MTKPSVIHRMCSAIRLGLRLHGIRLPLVLMQRCWRFMRLRWSGPQTFEFAGQTHRYHFDYYSLDNERAVEVALARDFLRGRTGNILEVGNVLSHYLDFPHDIVDKYEIAPGVINEDIVGFSPGRKYDYIVSLSTLEHVGWDEQPREPEKIIKAVNHLKKLLKDGGQMLATMPLGYNPHVDELVRTRQTGFEDVRYLRRISSTNRWREVKWEEVDEIPYNSPFPCANAIIVGTFSKPPSDKGE